MAGPDLRIPEWARLSMRPTVAVEPALPGAAAVQALAEVARRRRWRVTIADDGQSVRIKDNVALVVNLLQVVAEPSDFWRSSILTAEASDDGVGGSRIEVTVTDHGSIRLRRRTATLLSAWVAAMEARGTRVRTGLWRDEALDRWREAKGQPQHGPKPWYAEGRRLDAIAAREAAARPAPGPFVLTEGLRAWADGLADACGTADQPLDESSARAWIDGLVSIEASRRRQPKPAYVVDALVDAALGAGVLRLPEPGVLRMAFAHRDDATESETAWGWGFKPASTAALTWHAARACTLDELTTEAGGAAAVADVLGAVVASLGSLRVGPVDDLRCW